MACAEAAHSSSVDARLPKYAIGNGMKTGKSSTDALAKLIADEFEELSG